MTAIEELQEKIIEAHEGLVKTYEGLEKTREAQIKRLKEENEESRATIKRLLAMLDRIFKEVEHG